MPPDPSDTRKPSRNADLASPAGIRARLRKGRTGRNSAGAIERGELAPRPKKPPTEDGKKIWGGSRARDQPKAASPFADGSATRSAAGAACAGCEASAMT